MRIEERDVPDLRDGDDDDEEREAMLADFLRLRAELEAEGAIEEVRAVDAIISNLSVKRNNSAEFDIDP